MSVPKIHEGEYRFCLIMWEHQPVKAVELAKLCQEKLAWKRTTTYTIIKRMGERGVLKLENGVVTALISKEEAEAAEIKTFVESKFGGNLPAFEQGEKIYLEPLDRMKDLRGITVTALDEDGFAVFSVFVSDNEGSEPINFITCDDWIIAPNE